MITLFWIMLSIFIGYVGAIITKYGILPSISDSYYRLPKNLNFLFTFFCWGFALPAMIIGLDITNSFLMFLAPAGIMFVGAAAAFKEDLTHTVHTIGAVVGVLFSQLSIAFNFHLYWLNAVFLIPSAIMLLANVKNKIWWIETIAFLSICYALASKLF